jgi:hypothetical protein
MGGHQAGMGLVMANRKPASKFIEIDPDYDQVPVQNQFPLHNRPKGGVMAERIQLIEAELDTLYHQPGIEQHPRSRKITGSLEILHKRSGMRSGMITLRN